MQKVAVVTGSSKGIGKAIAIRLAREGYFVYITYYTDKAGGEDTTNQIKKMGGTASLNKLDASNEKDVTQLMMTVKKEFGHLDVLINASARSIDKRMEDSSFEEWKLGIDSKLHGAWLCTKYAIPLLKLSQNANVIMISSNADEHPSPEVLSYAISIAATNSLTKALAIHLPSYGIRVNAVMPGPTRTDNWGELKNDDKFWKHFAEKNPMKRVTTFKDIADAVMLLINDPNKFINGNLFYVSGGSHLM